MPAPSSSRIDPVIGHLAELVGGAPDDSPGGLLAVLANMPDPRHHRRGPPPVQPAHPRHPAPGMPRALVRLETPPPGQRPHVALRPPEPTSQTAVVVPVRRIAAQCAGLWPWRMFAAHVPVHCRVRAWSASCSPHPQGCKSTTSKIVGDEHHPNTPICKPIRHLCRFRAKRSACR